MILKSSTQKGGNRIAEYINKYTFPTDIWYGGGEIEVEFPKNWKVEKVDMEGYDSPVLSDDEIKERIESPIGCPPIEEGAKGAKGAAIVFDDLTRPTRTKRIAKVVLEKLSDAGVPKDSIRFIMGQGAHRTHNRLDFAKKLGKEITDEYPAFPHNPFHNCKRIGTTSFGTPVEINAEFMNCDYKIGIGGIVPHPQMGFGGGGKLVVPGVASMETIRKNHHLSISPQGETMPNAGWGCYSSNEHRKDVEEIARMAGLNFKVDCFFNYEGRITRVFAGDPIEEHHAGVDEAMKYYRTEIKKDADLVIANAFCKANEAGLALQTAQSLKEEGGDLVIVTNIPEGLAPHYLYGGWGVSKIGGFEWNERKSLPDRVKKEIIFTKYIDKGQSWWFGPREELIWKQDWNEVVDEIGKEEKEVALYPDGTINLLVE